MVNNTSHFRNVLFSCNKQRIETSMKAVDWKSNKEQFKKFFKSFFNHEKEHIFLKKLMKSLKIINDDCFSDATDFVDLFRETLLEMKTMSCSQYVKYQEVHERCYCLAECILVFVFATHGFDFEKHVGKIFTTNFISKFVDIIRKTDAVF